MACWRRWTSRAAGFLRLDPARRRLGLEATVRLPLASLWLRWRGLGPLQRSIDRRHPARAVILDDATLAAHVLAVESAARVWHANCLRRSLTLYWMLRRRGAAPDLRIGVRSDGERPAFHAWLELDGSVLNDAADVASHYAPFQRQVTPPGARFE